MYVTVLKIDIPSLTGLGSHILLSRVGPGSSVGCAYDWYSGGRGFDPPVWQHSFVEMGHELIFMAISLYR